MKTAALLVAAIAGGATGGFLVWAAGDGGNEPARTTPLRITTPTEREPDVSNEILAALAEIDRRLAKVEGRVGLGPRAAGDDGSDFTDGGPGMSRGAPRLEGAPAMAKDPKRKAADVVRGFVGKRFGPREFAWLFKWLSDYPGEIDETVAGLQEAVEKDPTNPELQTALATALVGKLVNATQPGPAQGQVWGLANAAYEAALRNDPEHWQARSGQAFGTSMIPGFLGQRPKAIKQFEELRKRQESIAPEKHFSQTYYRLGSLYKEEGNVEKAREIWQKGLDLFPNNKDLKDALDVSTRK